MLREPQLTVSVARFGLIALSRTGTKVSLHGSEAPPCQPMTDLERLLEFRVQIMQEIRTVHLGKSTIHNRKLQRDSKRVTTLLNQS